MPTPKSPRKGQPHSYKRRQLFIKVIYNTTGNNLQRYRDIIRTTNTQLHKIIMDLQSFVFNLIHASMHQSRRGDKKIRPNASAYVLRV
jgi:hypothetical protein